MKKRTMVAMCMALTLGSMMLFTGCGGSGDESTYSIDKEAATTEEAMADYSVSEDVAEIDTENFEDVVTCGTPEGDGSSQVSDNGKKKIVTWNISLDVENYDETMELISKLVDKYNGYIESDNSYFYNDEYHESDQCIRIPQDQTDAFMKELLTFETITARSKSTEDVTSSYIDVESRIQTLKSEKEAFENLMEKAETVEDILKVESKLSEVNGELESFESQMRYLKNATSYDSVYVNVTEHHVTSWYESHRTTYIMMRMGAVVVIFGIAFFGFRHWKKRKAAKADLTK